MNRRTTAISILATAAVLAFPQLAPPPQIGASAVLQVDKNQDGVADVFRPAVLEKDNLNGTWTVVYWQVDPLTVTASHHTAYGPIVKGTSKPGVRVLK